MKTYSFGIVILLILEITGCDTQRPEKPNIVLVVPDELGWKDVKCLC